MPRAAGAPDRATHGGGYLPATSGLVDVVIEEPADDDGRPQQEGPGRRAHRLRPVAVVLVLVLAGVVANALEQRDRSVRLETLRGLHGVVADLDVPVHRTWQVDMPVGGSVAGELALVAAPSRYDTPLRAVDLRDGAVRWTLPRLGEGAVVGCAGDPEAPVAQVVVCWLQEPAVGAGGMLVVDPVDGSVRDRYDVPLPSAGHGVDGDGLVLGEQTGRVLTVRRVDLRTGVEQWRVAVELDMHLLDGTYRATVGVEDGLAVVRGPTTAVLDAGTGQVLGTWHSPDESGVITGLDGADVRVLPRGFAVQTGTVDGQRALVTVLHDRSGRVLGSAGGAPAEPEVSDGSRPDLLLTRVAGELLATDVDSGRHLWTAQASGPVLLRLDGQVVVVHGTSVVGLDLLGGAELWRTDVPGLRPDAGWVTDGEHVVLATLDHGRFWHLVAIRLDGGGPAWTVPAPGPVATGPSRLGDFGSVQARSGWPVLVAPGGLTGFG